MREPELHYSLDQTSEDTLCIHFLQNNVAVATPKVSQKIALCSQRICEKFRGIVFDCVPSYTTLLIYYDFARVTGDQFCQSVGAIIEEELTINPTEPVTRSFEVPVYYSEETGPDLAFLAEGKKMSVEQLIERHSEKTYTVYAIGFSPGFAYMGFVEPALASTRLASPRKSVPKGSVGIADKQTGIYPIDSPGGWNIIGRTTLDIFDNSQPVTKRCKFNVGDTIKFTSVCKEEFLSLGGNLS